MDSESVDVPLPSIRMAEFPSKMPIIAVGENLPCGQRLLDAKTYRIIRLNDFGRHKRLLLCGVIGAYTPPCWNIHVNRLLDLLGPWCSEAENGEVCIIATNDCDCLSNWAKHLKLPESVRLLSDFTGKFTRLLGMDIQVQGFGSLIRSRRYILQADNMEVRKIMVAPDDGGDFSLECQHNSELD